MVVAVLTEHGLPVPGATVSTTLLAAKGTNARMMGAARAITDANGTATLRLGFRAGRSTNYTLLLATEEVLELLTTQEGFSTLVTSRAQSLQTSITSAVVAQVGGQVSEIADELIATLQADITTALEAELQVATDQTVQAATDCLVSATGLPSSTLTSLGSVGSEGLPASSLSSGAGRRLSESQALDACLTTAVSDQLNSLVVSK